MAEWIEVLFGAETRGPKAHCTIVPIGGVISVRRGEVSAGKVCPLFGTETWLREFDAAFAKSLWPFVKYTCM